MTMHNGFISVEFIDAYGIPATTLYNVTVDGTQTVQLAVDEMTALAGLEAVLSQGSNVKTRLTLEFAGIGGAAAGDIEKGGLFNLSNGTDTYLTGFLVPDIAPTVLNGAGLIDLTNADVLTWISWLTTAHTAITVVTKGVRALTALYDALITFRKHRKPLSRKTKET
jgi:hypothetical protein